jgi:AraC-like DNA-binding protein
VAAVGARWGYPDPAHFSRLFKATYGMGPRDYRASQGPALPDRRHPPADREPALRRSP